MAELRLPHSEVLSAPGHAAYAFSKLSDLYDALDRGYKLGVSLPDAPLEVFRKRTASLPINTETERLTVVRIGQNIFRDALHTYKQDVDGCETARQLVRILKTNGPSGYALVGLTATLDDLSLDASRGETQVVLQTLMNADKDRSSRFIGDLSLLTSAGTGVSDISELIMHATLRYVSAEETLLSSISRLKIVTSMPTLHG
ncbi:MAG: endonuclease [Edaphobacter sp.]|nr:endonuclease [Edaphobacter sp.]